MNNSVSRDNCYSRDDLRSYLLGDLPDPDLDRVAVHVEDCPDCETTIAELDINSDTLIESLRHPIEADRPKTAYRLAAKRAISLWKGSQNSAQFDSAEKKSDASLLLKMLRDYELLEPLAHGGMGTVYSARHQKLNRRVALKVLPSRLLEDSVTVARFEREMQAVGSLQHPAIVQATDGGEVDGIHFLVMELIDGMDGANLVRNLGKVPVADACEIARQAALGMAYVHEQGIIHRDLKPSNIMVTKTGDVKVLDLGLARVVDHKLADDELTTIGQLMGTLDFMAPEQLENSHEADERSDIYSLGAALFKLLTGSSPHACNSQEPILSKLRRIASSQSQPLSQHCPDASAELCALVDSMLSHDTGARPDSMLEVAQSLESFCDGCNLTKQLKQARQAAKREVSSRPQENRLQLPSQSENRRVSNRWIGWVAGLLALTSAAMGTFITLQTNSGTLVIETNTPDVEVRVMKAGKPYKQMVVSQKAGSLRLGAGEYEVQLLSKADSLQVENGTYTLKRGETWLARVVQKADNSPIDSTDTLWDKFGQSQLAAGVHAESSAPTYEGKTLQQWITLLKTERSPKQLYEGCQALTQLAVGAKQNEASEALLEAVHFHSSYATFEIAAKSHAKLWDSVRNVLARFELNTVFDELSKKLETRNEAHTKFAIHFLSKYHSPSQEPITHPGILEHLQDLAKHKDSQIRQGILTILAQHTGPEFAATHLAKALTDEDRNLQLQAAELLIEIQAHKDKVVSKLRENLGSEHLHHRAKAAWLLGDIGRTAASATPELIAIVDDDDPSVSKEAVLAQYNSVGMVSTKDAAIRALAEIGDASVVPLLMQEWELRAYQTRGPTQRSPAWTPGRSSAIQANSYSDDWVADAIERLIGMRPHENSKGGIPRWTIDGQSLRNIYSYAFRNELSQGVHDRSIRNAKRLLEKADAETRATARRYIAEIKSYSPKEIMLPLQTTLIELLAAPGEEFQTLNAMLTGMKSAGGFPTPASHKAFTAAYRQCAIRILRKAPSFDHDHLSAMAHYGPNDSTMIMLEIMDEFSPNLQRDCIAFALNSFDEHIATPDADKASAKIGAWLENQENSDLLKNLLQEQPSQEFIESVVGLLRFDLLDDRVQEIVVRRFADNSINRGALLVHALAESPSIPSTIPFIQVILKHEALDLTELSDSGEEISLRATWFASFSSCPESQRHHFRAMLTHYAEHGVHGEAEAAKALLQSWN